VFKDKPRSVLLESRVWTLLYQMGFDLLSGKGGAQLVADPRDTQSPKTQIDCVAIDSEVGLACECKTFLEPKKDPDFLGTISRLSGIRKGFVQSIKKQFPFEKENSKRHIATILFTWDFLLSESDAKRAAAQNVVLFDEQALEYYRKLVAHLGPAARYQFLSEVFPSTQIEGLEIKTCRHCERKQGKLFVTPFPCARSTC